MNLARLLIASAAVVLPASHVAAMDGPEAVAASDAFAPPSTPLILTRTLYRDLPGGGKIVVTRQYAVQFSTDGDGYRLDGQLLDTMVQVPERLSALAEVERKRPDSGLFPAYLDRNGLIRSDAGSPALFRARRCLATGRAGAFEKRASSSRQGGTGAGCGDDRYHFGKFAVASLPVQSGAGRTDNHQPDRYAGWIDWLDRGAREGGRAHAGRSSAAHQPPDHHPAGRHRTDHARGLDPGAKTLTVLFYLFRSARNS